MFADFLIATEAEINKVSWTSRQALIRDTIVVLTTLFLLTVFLFVVDLFWSSVLSSRYIGVLPTARGSGPSQFRVTEPGTRQRLVTTPA